MITLAITGIGKNSLPDPNLSDHNVARMGALLPQDKEFKYVRVLVMSRKWTGGLGWCLC